MVFQKLFGGGGGKGGEGKPGDGKSVAFNSRDAIPSYMFKEIRAVEGGKKKRSIRKKGSRRCGDARQSTSLLRCPCRGEGGQKKATIFFKRGI